MMGSVCPLVIKSSKPRNWVAKDLRTPKYRIRIEESKKKYSRKEKHRGNESF
jgi:stalled ribosome alternative rescue factor ArfA